MNLHIAKDKKEQYQYQSMRQYKRNKATYAYKCEDCLVRSGKPTYYGWLCSECASEIVNETVDRLVSLID